MITDDERRDVAEILRKTRVKRYNSILNGIHLGESVGVGAQIVSPHEDQVRAAADHLADLIEPPTQCPFYHSDRHYCSVHEDLQVIDRDALLELEKELDKEAEHRELSCFDRSVAIVGTRYVREVSRRIREALGVDDG